MKKTKILIIEDDRSLQNLFKKWLDKHMEIVQAYTIEDGKKFFEENPDFDAIAIDGCIPGVELNTLPLIKKIRENFKGLMIAISSDPDYRKEMVAAGCDEECSKPKLPEFLLHHFNK